MEERALSVMPRSCILGSILRVFEVMRRERREVVRFVVDSILDRKKFSFHPCFNCTYHGVSMCMQWNLSIMDTNREEESVRIILRQELFLGEKCVLIVSISGVSLEGLNCISSGRVSYG